MPLTPSQNFKALFENAADVVLRLDRNQRFVFANKAIEKAMNIGVDKCLGNTVREADLPGIVCEEFEARLPVLFHQGEEQVFDLDFEIPAGKRYFNVRLVPEVDGQGTTQAVLAILRCQTGSKEERWSIINAAPIFNADGKVEMAISIFRDFTERKTTENQLREALRIRNEFISIASHELKTPLTSLLLQLQSVQHLIQKPKTDGTLDELLEEVMKRTGRSVDQVRRLGNLVESLLDISRLSNGTLDLVKEPLDLADAVAEACEGLEEDARRAGCKISFKRGQNTEGSWDRVRVTQAITNLMSNALKYGEGKPVAVEVEARGDKALVTVRDQGPGIAQEDQIRIFDRFERAASHENISGMGLGLYIARQIAEAHGGALSVASQRDHGAAFTLSLPLRHDDTRK